jgi:hypothetical protein
MRMSPDQLHRPRDGAAKTEALLADRLASLAEECASGRWLADGIIGASPFIEAGHEESDDD